MFTGSVRRRARGSGSTGLAIGAIALFLASGSLSAGEPSPPPAYDAGAEIRAQGAAALQQMTERVKSDGRWGERGAAELAAVLERGPNTDHQVAGNTNSNCTHCHEIKERG